MLMVLREFLANDGGETMIEYGLLVALASLTIITATSLMGTSLSGFFTSVSSSLDSITSSAG